MCLNHYATLCSFVVGSIHKEFAFGLHHYGLFLAID